MKVNQTKACSFFKDQATIPPRLQNAIDDFFSKQGTPTEINEHLFSMLEFATVGFEEAEIKTKEVSSFIYFYKNATDLFKQLHSFTETNIVPA